MTPGVIGSLAWASTTVVPASYHTVGGGGDDSSGTRSSMPVSWGGGVPSDGDLIVAVVWADKGQVFTPPASWGAALDTQTLTGGNGVQTAKTYSWTASSEPSSYTLTGTVTTWFGASLLYAYKGATLYSHSLALYANPTLSFPLASMSPAPSSYRLVGLWCMDDEGWNASSLAVPATARGSVTGGFANCLGADKAASGSPTPSYTATGTTTAGFWGCAAAGFVITAF